MYWRVHSTLNSWNLWWYWSSDLELAWKTFGTTPLTKGVDKSNINTIALSLLKSNKSCISERYDPSKLSKSNISCGSFYNAPFPIHPPRSIILGLKTCHNSFESLHFIHIPVEFIKPIDSARQAVRHKKSCKTIHQWSESMKALLAYP